MICSENCNCKNNQECENDIILAAIRLLRVIDNFGTRLDESEAINQLRVAALSRGYLQQEKGEDAAH